MHVVPIPGTVNYDVFGLCSIDYYYAVESVTPNSLRKERATDIRSDKHPGQRPKPPTPLKLKLEV